MTRVCNISQMFSREILAGAVGAGSKTAGGLAAELAAPAWGNTSLKGRTGKGAPRKIRGRRPGWSLLGRSCFFQGRVATNSLGVLSSSQKHQVATSRVCRRAGWAGSLAVGVTRPLLCCCCCCCSFCPEPCSGFGLRFLQTKHMLRLTLAKSYTYHNKENILHNKVPSSLG